MSQADTIDVPFSSYIGIERTADQQHLQLPFHGHVRNHLGTFHAGAQFSLMETASGEFLQQQFPDLAGKVTPVLRKAEVKYRHAATSDLTAVANVEDEVLVKFERQFRQKGRALILITVELTDLTGQQTATGQYEWFIQALTG